MSLIIGLGHKAQVGKDTIGEYLVKSHGFQRLAFADNLKDGAREIFGFDEDQLYGDLKEVVDEYWGFTPRWALQMFGTDAMKPVFGEDIWVRSLGRLAMRYAGSGIPVVITDLRFHEEAEAIKTWGGFVVKVSRPSREVIATSQHRSETALDDFKNWDLIVNNIGTIPELWQASLSMLDRLREKNGE